MPNDDKYSQFVRLEYRRRLAMRKASDLRNESTSEPNRKRKRFLRKAATVLEIFAGEVLLANNPITPAVYDAKRDLHILQAHIAAYDLLEVVDAESDLAALLAAALTIFEQAGAMLDSLATAEPA